MLSIQIIKRKILKHGEVWSIPSEGIGNIVTHYLAFFIVLYPILY